MSKTYPKDIFAQHISRKDQDGKPLQRPFTEAQWKMLPKDKDGYRKGWKQINPPTGKKPKELKEKSTSDVNATQTAIDLASESKLDITKIEGSGANGSVTKKDVQNAIKEAESKTRESETPEGDPGSDDK